MSGTKKDQQLYRNRNFLYQEYITKEKSIVQLKREYGWHENTIRRWLHYHNINIRQYDHPIVRQQKSKPTKENHPRWRGFVTNNGYRYVYIPNHPKANKHGYVSESRVVAESKIQRPLKDTEIVHHINGKRCDNKPDNLFVCTRGEHRDIHATIDLIVYQLTECGNVVFDNENGYKLVN